MLKLRGSTFLLSYIAAMAMSSCSCVGLAGAPSTLIHSLLTIGTILHPSCYSKFYCLRQGTSKRGEVREARKLHKQVVP